MLSQKNHWKDDTMEIWYSEPPKSAKRKRNRSTWPFSWSSALGTFAPRYKGPAINVAVRQRKHNSRSNLNDFHFPDLKEISYWKTICWVTSASSISKAPPPLWSLHHLFRTEIWHSKRTRHRQKPSLPAASPCREMQGQSDLKNQGKPLFLPRGGQNSLAAGPPH